MSILIKGMKMPKGCLGCPCINAKYNECMILQRRAMDVMTRMTDCPLVELPTADELAEDMRTAAKIADEEASHSTMDDIMCGILCQIGYEEAVAIFDDTPKWYA